MRQFLQSTKVLLIVLLSVFSNKAFGQTFYDLSAGDYSQNFSTISSWTNNYASGTGAENWKVASGTVFSTGTGGGVQKGTEAMIFLATGTAVTTTDLLLNFTNRAAGKLTLDWEKVLNSPAGTRDGVLKLQYSVDNGANFTDFTGYTQPVFANSAASQSGNISIDLPSALGNKGQVVIRFFVTRSTQNGGGSNPKVQIDNLLITSTSLCTAPTPGFVTAPASIDCPNKNVVYETQAGMTNYVWTLPGTAGTDYTLVSGGTSTSNTMTVRWLTSGSKTVTVGYTSGTCASTTPASYTSIINGVSIAPTAIQNLTTGSNGTALSVTENGTASVRVWKYTTTSGSAYTAFTPNQAGTSYTPNFATPAIYYVVAESTFACGVVRSNEVRINVTALQKPVISSATTKTSAYGTADTYTITASNTPTSYAVTPSTLPTGFSFNATTGVLSAVNTTDANTYNFSITATNSAGASDPVALVWTINKRNVTVSNVPSPTKVYDQTVTAVLNLSGATINNLLASDTGQVTVAATGYTANYNNKNVGTNKTITITGVTLTGAKADNYAISSQPTATGAITVASLTVTGATAQNKTYDGTTAATITGASLQGVYSGDVVSINTSTGTFANANVGTGITVSANITPTGADANNYSITQPTGLTANITKANPTFNTSPISVTNNGGTYVLVNANISDGDGAITYSLTNNGHATLSGNTITGGATLGTETLSVTQAAGANYNGGTATIVVNVIDLPVADGDFMTKTTGTWTSNTSGTATWQKRENGAWVDSDFPTGTSNGYTVFITKNIQVPAAGPSPFTTGKVYVTDKATLTFDNTGSNWALKGLVIDNEATVQMNGRFRVDNAFNIKDGGTFIYNYSNNGFNGMPSYIFAGTENFEPNSNFIVKDLNGGNFLEAAIFNAITVNTNNSYFGNIIVDYSAGTGTLSFFTSNAQTSAAFANTICNDLIFRSYGSGSLRMYQNTTAGIIGSASPIKIGGNFITENSFTNNINFTTASIGGTLVMSVAKNFILNGGTYYNLNSTNNNSSLFNLNIGGDMILNGTSKYGFRNNIASTATITVNLSGNLFVDTNASLVDEGTNGIMTGNLNFVRTGNSIAQTIDFKNPSSNTRVTYSVRNGASAQLINQDLALGNLAEFAVATGGTFNFGLNVGETTSLKIKNATGTLATAPKFTSATGSIVKVTSADGITQTSPIGNVLVTGIRAYNNVAEYQYIGPRTPQSLGDALVSGNVVSNLKITINKPNATDIVNVNTNIKTTSDINIVKGTLIEPDADNSIAGTSGNLIMTADATYKTAAMGVTVPQLTGIYNLAIGSTIELNAIGNQTLRGAQTYKNLTFSNGGEKGVSASTAAIDNILIKDNTIVNPGSFVFGGTSTRLTMQNTALLKLSGSDTKPDMGGAYTLAPTTKIEFTGSSAKNIRLTPTYANITVSGDNVSVTSATDDGLTLQSGTSLHVTDTGVFKLDNPNGFSGANNTAIKNTNNPSIVLDPLSIIEYNGASQVISHAAVTSPADANYQNLRVSATGTKTATGTTHVKNLTVVTAGELLVATTADNVNANILYAHKGINNTGGKVRFANNAILMQDAAAVNIGHINLERIANVPARQYNLWASPVQAQNLYNLYGAAGPVAAGKVMVYDTKKDGFTPVPANATSVFGKGYSAAGLASNTVTAIFDGVPNNGGGSIVASTEGNGYNLIGNPYPSNLDIDTWYLANSNNIDLTDNTAYLWDNTSNNDYSQIGANYSGDNYAQYNFSSKIGKPAPRIGNSKTPTHIVKSGQGFLVKVKKTASAPFVFDNTMRTASNLGTFFKNNPEQNNRYWLEMTTPRDLIISLAVSYNDQAINSFDKYDSTIFNENASDLFYTKSTDAEKLAIQGRSTFDIKDIIPVGVKTYEAGDYTIRVANKEGVFAGDQTIYLHDKKLSKIINLTDGDYHFSLIKGADDARFEIVYQEATLNVNDTNAKGDITVYKSKDSFVIQSAKGNISKVEVYDMNGRLILVNNKASKAVSVSHLDLLNSTYVLKIYQGQNSITKKVIK